MYDFFAKLLMYDFFAKLLNMSLAASIIVLVIVVLRLLLKKAPKNIICFLWALVALRLILPFSIQSDMSAFNMMQSSVDNQGQIEYFQYNGKTEKPLVEFSVPALVNDNASPDSMTIGEHTSDLYLPPVISIWLAGVCVMLLYAIGSYLYLRKKVGASIPRQKGLKMSDDISTPFILGVLKPVIYIPSGMDEKTMNHVIAHEEAHIKRRDHWWKPLGYFLLTVYWFNPMIWLAYVLLCRDIEMACDEKVIRDMDKDSVAEYSQALLDCSFPRRRIAACPLAFGEVGVKERVRSVLNYKKPAFWVIAVAVVACIVVAVCFLTNPKAEATLSEMLSPDYRTDGVWTYLSEDYSVSSSFVVNDDRSIAGIVSKDGETTDFSVLYRMIKGNDNRAVCEFYNCEPEIANQAEGESHFMFEARMKVKNGKIQFEFFDENGATCFGEKKVQFTLAVSEADQYRDFEAAASTDDWIAARAWPLAEEYAAVNGFDISEDDYYVFRYTDGHSADVIFQEADMARSIYVSFSQNEDGSWAPLPANAVNLIERDRWDSFHDLTKDGTLEVSEAIKEDT